MTAQAARHDATATGARRQLGRRLGLCGLLVVLILAALLLGRWRADHAREAILAQQRDMQQAWLDASLTAIGAWRGGLAGEAAFIADLQLFRPGERDAHKADAGGLAGLAGPEAPASGDEHPRLPLPSMEEVLRKLTKQRGWGAARILAPDATPLVAPDSATPLGSGERGLVRLAGKSGKEALGPLRMTDKGLVMDLAEPLPAEGGSGQAQAVLLLTVPMNKTLAGFLGLGGQRGGALLPRIVDQGPDGPFMLLLKGEEVVREQVATTLVHELEPAVIPFMRREGLDGYGEVYSLGAQAAVPDWRMVLETPAATVDALIRSQALQNYLLFLAIAAALWLLILLISLRAASRTFEARNRVLRDKNATISRQKALLDSVNASLHAGLVLVDSQGRVQMENRAFTALAGRKEAIPPGTPLVEVLPGKVAVQLLGDMAVVHDCGKSATVEVTLPPLPDAPADDDEGERLFRVALHPYGADAQGGEPGTTGCVASFQDITRFRRNTEQSRQRQLALITALVRAIESVDPCQAGHSDRMARLAGLVAEELDLDLRERETLGLAARLSQIGKIFVPREILTKRGALTPEERKEALRAPEHADRILHDLHFDLPVRETVREMGERMDGSGSPQGLTGEEISRAGRVLAVVNAFVAMTSPRPWRDDKGMEAAEALDLLAHDLRFDQEVVAALARVAASPPLGRADSGGAQP